MEVCVATILVLGFALFAFVWVKYVLRPMAREQRRTEEADFRRYERRVAADEPPACPNPGAAP